MTCMDMRHDIWPALLGLAIGDAFGMPFECCRRGAFDIARGADGGYEMPAFRPNLPPSCYDRPSPPPNFFEQPMPPGIWTDDTAMTLAELESIARLGRIDPEDMMRNFCRWNDVGAFTATGAAIGQGRRTLAALKRFRAGTPALRCGGVTERDNGDGSLMCMLPFVFADRLMVRDGVTVGQLSAMTHGHEIAMRACALYCEVGRRIRDGLDRADCVRDLPDRASPFERLGDIARLPEAEIRSGGYVVEALEAALWSFVTTDTFEACILRAVRLGGDTDTIAAIAGSLAGMYYGMDGIPVRWIDRLYRLDTLRALCAAFMAALRGERDSATEMLEQWRKECFGSVGGDGTPLAMASN